jgi:uncharacterized membrane protein YjfL (UPF0719 family)
MRKIVLGLSLWLFTILICIILFLPVFVVIHEYSHLATCILLGGEGSVSFEGIFLTGSFMQMQKAPTESLIALVLLSGGFGAFIVCLVLFFAMQFFEKKLPKWTIFAKETFLFWGVVGLMQAIPEWYFWKNIIFLTPIDNIFLFLIYLSTATIICHFVCKEKSLNLFLKKRKPQFQ